MQQFTKNTYRVDYIQGGFAKRRNNHKKKYPRSYYCYICFCKEKLNWHHAGGYKTLYHEDFFRDGWWECDPKCPCSQCDESCPRNCHFLSHEDSQGNLLPKTKEVLEERRKQLRRQYILQYVRPTTVVPFLLQCLYRLFW